MKINRIISLFSVVALILAGASGCGNNNRNISSVNSIEAEFNSDKYYVIVNRSSGKCIDSKGYLDDRSKVLQWSLGNKMDQYWQISDDNMDLAIWKL
jgi:hypothetical protein